MSVFLADEQKEQVDLAALHRLAELVLSEEGYPDSTELTVLLVDQKEMASYNERFLHRDGPTDVLAFPVEDLVAGQVPDVDVAGPPLMIGDVIISPSFVKSQATHLGVDFQDELALMVTHGILHLIGYDHHDEGDAELMERRETELLEKVGRSRR